MRSEKFGRLLKGAIGSIVTHEGKTAPVVEEELGNQLGLTAASIQRYKAGHLPPDPHTIEVFATAAVKRGYLNRDWLNSFLQAAHYPQPTKLLEELCPLPLLQNINTYDNLPAPTYSRFVERKKAYAEIIEGLKQRAPVVLLVSMGGMGKTSLAREVAQHCIRRKNPELPFTAVVWVSDQYQPATTTLETVLNEIALTLDYPALIHNHLSQKRREVDLLLRRRAVLLVIDNFETITDSELVQWLLTLPEPCKTLITSREYRREFQQNSWAVNLEGLNPAEAGEFLAQKANALKLESIVGDMSQLEPLLQASGGNPKALEIALGHIRYSNKTLAQVTAGLNTARDEIFEGLFRRSWEMLDERAQAILKVMPLFIGSAQAEALAATAGLPLAESEEALAKLTGLALIEVQRVDVRHPSRYTLHPLARAFAGAKLKTDPAFEEEARIRQLEWYIALAATVGYCWDDLSRLNRLDPEQETIHHVIQVCAAKGQYAYLSRLIREVDYYYYIRGLWVGEPEISYLRVEAAHQTGDVLEETRALSYFIQMLSRQNRVAEAIQYIARLETLNGDTLLPETVLFEVQYTLGMYAMACQDYAKAITIWQNTLNLAKSVSVRAYAVTRGQLAICYYRQKNLSEARALWQEVLVDSRINGSERGVVSSLIGLARVCMDMAELEEVPMLLAEANKLAEKEQDKGRLAEINLLYTRYYILQGDNTAAANFGDKARDAFERLGMPTELDEVRQLLNTRP